MPPPTTVNLAGKLKIFGQNANLLMKLGAAHLPEPPPDQALSYHKGRRGTKVCLGVSVVGGGEHSTSPLLYPFLLYSTYF